MENLSTLEIQNINKRLAETIAWCASRVDLLNPETCFRSKELEPPISIYGTRINLWDINERFRKSDIRDALYEEFMSRENRERRGSGLDFESFFIFSLESQQNPELTVNEWRNTSFWYSNRLNENLFDYRRVLAQRQSIVEGLSILRKSILSRQKLDQIKKDLDLSFGRVLCYEPDSNLCDGAARDASKGFLDVDNTPPWDTWFAYLPEENPKSGNNGRLLSWVSREFVSFIEQGIWANPESCIFWLEDEKVQQLFVQKEIERTP